MTGREEDARDATQEAFLTALRKLSSFRGEAAFTTWLHRVTVNACYDLLRKRQRQPLLERGGDDDLPAPSRRRRPTTPTRRCCRSTCSGRCWRSPRTSAP